MTDLDYCILDGSFACIVDGEFAWFFSHGEWHPIPSGDAHHNARVVTKDYFDRLFGELPPLPED
jgi:hypothetical protein